MVTVRVFWLIHRQSRIHWLLDESRGFRWDARESGGVDWLMNGWRWANQFSLMRETHEQTKKQGGNNWMSSNLFIGGVLCPTNVSVCVWFTLFFDLCCCFPLLWWPRSHLHQVVFLQVGLQDGIFDGSKYKSNVLRIWNKHGAFRKTATKETMNVVTYQLHT